MPGGATCGRWLRTFDSIVANTPKSGWNTTSDRRARGTVKEARPGNNAPVARGIPSAKAKTTAIAMMAVASISRVGRTHHSTAVAAPKDANSVSVRRATLNARPNAQLDAA